MLKFGEVNPLAVFGLRQLEHCPPHFTPVQFDIRTNEKVISDWIHGNLTGRFYLGDSYSQGETGIELFKCAAFEIPGEASYFALNLDQINQREDW